MKILWLFPPSKFEGEIPLISQNRWFKYLPMRTNFIYPVIAAYGITMIKEAEYEIDFCDAPAEQLKLEDIRIEDYDLIVMEGRTAIIKYLWELSKEFKKINPDVKIALYGDHVMVRPEESLIQGIDYIIHCGDYDYGALQLINALSESDDVPKIFKAPLMEDLNELPFIDRDLVPWKNYYETWRHREEFGWFQSGRGCWADCTFCSWVHTFYNKKIGVMSPERIVDEIEYASEKWGIREYLDDADTFLANWGVKFGKILIEKELNIYWNVQTRADEILKGTIDEWRLMKESGLHVVKLGVDGGSECTLQRIRKGYDIQCVEKAMKILKEANLETHINMIIGYPWETKKQAYDVIKWVKRLNPNQAQFSLIQPFIGTPIYDEAIKEGWFNIDPDDYNQWDMKRPILKGKMSAEEIVNLHRNAWGMFYLNPSFILRQIGKSTMLAFKERNLDSFRHLWRGYKGVVDGHQKAVSVSK